MCPLLETPVCPACLGLLGDSAAALFNELLSHSFALFPASDPARELSQGDLEVRSSCFLRTFAAGLTEDYVARRVAVPRGFRVRETCPCFEDAAARGACCSGGGCFNSVYRREPCCDPATPSVGLGWSFRSFVRAFYTQFRLSCDVLAAQVLAPLECGGHFRKR